MTRNETALSVFVKILFARKRALGFKLDERRGMPFTAAMTNKTLVDITRSIFAAKMKVFWNAEIGFRSLYPLA